VRVLGRLCRGPCPGHSARWPPPVLLPLLKAHRFSHSLERAGQEWLSAASAMGPHAREGQGARAGLGIPARTWLPATGRRLHQLARCLPDGSWGWERRAGGRGVRDPRLGDPSPQHLPGLRRCSPWLDKYSLDPEKCLCAVSVCVCVSECVLVCAQVIVSVG
jgi:hypothetical protein